MELWILTQDKEALLKINKGLMYWYTEDKRHVIVTKESETGLSIIANYKTKERALEVLDEIQNILKPKYILNSSSIKEDGNSWVENGIIYQKYNADAKIEEINTYVYKMPEE